MSQKQKWFYSDQKEKVHENDFMKLIVKYLGIRIDNKLN